MRQYFTQMRQELGQRLVDKVFGSEDKPSKVSLWESIVCKKHSGTSLI